MMELLWYSYRFSGRCEHEATLFKPIPSGQMLYLTKKPPDTIRIGRAFLADPNLHVVSMIRDPRAVASSMHPDKPGIYFSGFRRWLEYVKVIEAFSGHPRWITIRYEDLLVQPDTVQARVEDAFPFLARQRSFSDYPDGADVPPTASLSLGGARPMDPGRIAGWRLHLPRVKDQLARYPEVAEKIIALGYEPSDEWQACLQGVEPKRQAYRKDDHPGFFRSMETAFRFWVKSQRYLRDLRARAVK